MGERIEMKEYIGKYELTLDEIIEQLVDIADTLRLKSQHNPMLDDLFALGEQIQTLAEWLEENNSRDDT